MKSKYRIIHKIHKNTFGEFVGEIYKVQSKFLFWWCDMLDYSHSVFDNIRDAKKFIVKSDGICVGVEKTIVVW